MIYIVVGKTDTGHENDRDDIDDYNTKSRKSKQCYIELTIAL